MSLLDERELTYAERAAITDEPRPGVWVSHILFLGGPGDGRLLSQHQTDILIARRLVEMSILDDAAPMRAVVGVCPPVEIDGQLVTDQRGGIHSEPLVRLFAFRAWGERDRRWRKRDTAAAVFDLDRGITNEHDRRHFERLRSAYQWSTLIVTFESVIATRDGREARLRFELPPRLANKEEWLKFLDMLDAQLDGVNP